MRLVYKLKEFGQVARDSQVEAVVAQRSEFVLYSGINGQPVERSNMRRDMISLGNSEDK